MWDVTAVTDGLTNRGGNWKIEQYSGRPETAGKQQTCSSPQTKISECLLLHCLAISPSASICQQSVRERIFIDPHCRSHTYLWCSCIGERRFNDPHIFSACHLFWREMDVDKSRRVSFNLWERKHCNIFCRCCWKQNCAATNLFEFSNQFQICNQGELRANLGRETDRFQEEIVGAF